MLYPVLAAALLHLSSSVVIEGPDTIVNGWTELKKTDAAQRIKLSFALRNQNVDLLEKTLMDVSTPGNPEYGNHRSVESLYELIAPSAEAIDAVQDWLLFNFDPEHIVRETP